MPTTITDERRREIAEIRKLDTNQDWLLSVDEQPTEFKLRIGANQAVSFWKYWKTPKPTFGGTQEARYGRIIGAER